MFSGTFGGKLNSPFSVAVPFICPPNLRFIAPAKFAKELLKELPCCRFMHASIFLVPVIFKTTDESDLIAPSKISFDLLAAFPDVRMHGPIEVVMFPMCLISEKIPYRCRVPYPLLLFSSTISPWRKILEARLSLLASMALANTCVMPAVIISPPHPT